MAKITRIVNNTNMQKEGSLLEKHVPGWKDFQKSYKTNTKVKLKHEQKLETLIGKGQERTCLTDQKSNQQVIFVWKTKDKV